MSKSWVRHEIKKNWLQHRTELLIGWLKTHRDYAAGIGITLLVAVFIGVYLFNRHKQLKELAWEKLFTIEQHAYSDKQDEALKQIDALLADLPKTDAASYALLFKGDIMYRTGQYQKAQEAYQQLIAKGSPAAVVPIAAAGVIYSLKAANNLDGAIATAKDFIEKNSQHFMLPMVYSTLAELQEQSGKPAEAKTTYDKIALHFARSYWDKTTPQQELPPQQQPGKPADKTGKLTPAK